MSKSYCSFFIMEDIIICIYVMTELIQDHPDVIKKISDATAAINSASITISQEMYMEALKNGINIAEEKKKEISAGSR